MNTPVVLRIYRKGDLIEVKQFKAEQISIGRSDSSDIRLDSDDVSLIHAAIDERDGQYYVCDLGSEKGTKKNGKLVLDEKLQSGDELQIGDYSIIFYIGIPKPKGTPGKPLQTATSNELEKKAEISKSKSQPQQQSTPLIEEPPKITSNIPKFNKGAQKSEKTFAPPSVITDLNSVIKPGQGPVLEMIVAWKERIVLTRHFAGHRMVTIGSTQKSDVVFPFFDTLKNEYPLIKVLGNQSHIFLTSDMQGELVQGEIKTSFNELRANNKLVKTVGGYRVDLNQNEMLRIDFQWGLVTVYIRWVADCPRVLPAPLFDLTTSELVGIIGSFIIALVLGLYVSVYSPDLVEIKGEEEIERVAKFVMNPPRKRYVIVPKDQVKQALVAETKPKVPPPKGVLEETKKEDRTAKKASQVKPKTGGTKNQFTSTKSGGSTKTSESPGANMQSEKKEPADMGLASILSNKGIQKSLDKTASGSGDLVGLAEKATGTSGLTDDRPGEGIGHKIKDIGKGGHGTSTVGISNIKTKGEGGTGFGGDGKGGKIGVKESVTIEPGGEEESFEGTIDKEAVRRVVKKQLKEIQYCYTKALTTRSNLHGKVVLEWVIGEQGRVTSVSVKKSNLGSKEAEKCIMDRLKNWRFPSPPANMEATVVYPFILMTNK